MKFLMHHYPHTKEYFINSEFGFAFKKPNNNWSDIESAKGIAGAFQIMSIKSQFITEKNIENGFNNSPLGPLFTNVTIYYFFNPDTKTNVEITDSTYNNLINALVKQKGKQLLDTTQIPEQFNLFDMIIGKSFPPYDTTKAKGKKDYYEDLKNYRRKLIGFDTVEAKESFILSVFPKSYLPLYLQKLSLPAFYTTMSNAMGLNADKLVANENQILSGGEITLNNVKIKKKIISFQNKKWMMFTENEKYFYIIEISYSPQISSSTDLWDDLQDTLNSFTILTE